MISIDFHYETFLLLFLVSALVICIVLKLKKRKFYDFIFNLSVLLYVLLLIKVVFFTNKNCFGPNKFCYLGGKYREFIATCSV